MSIHIRSFRGRDIETLVLLWRQFQRDPSVIDSPSLPPEKATRKWRYILLKQWRRKSIHIILAERNEQLVGYVVLRSRLRQRKREIAYIQEIYVHPDFRKMDLGTLLLQRGIKYLRDRGVKIIRVDVWFQNNIARDFFKKYGFEEHIVVLQKKLKSITSPIMSAGVNTWFTLT